MTLVILKDDLVAVDTGKFSTLILLDLSVACETVNCKVLLTHLRDIAGIHNTALSDSSHSFPVEFREL